MDVPGDALRRCIAETIGSEAVKEGSRDRRALEPEMGPIEVPVERENVARALSQLKRMMAREGVLKEVKNRRFYEKPSVKEKRKRRDAERRRRKDRRKMAG